MDTIDAVENTVSLIYETCSGFVLVLAVAAMAVLAIACICIATSNRVKSRGVSVAIGSFACVCVFGMLASFVFVTGQRNYAYDSAAADICMAYGINGQPSIQNDVAIQLGNEGGRLEYNNAFVSVPSLDYYQQKDIVFDLKSETFSGHDVFHTENIVRAKAYEKTDNGEFVEMEPVVKE